MTKWQQSKNSHNEKQEQNSQKFQKLQQSKNSHNNEKQVQNSQKIQKMQPKVEVQREQHGQKSQQSQKWHPAWHPWQKNKNPPKLQPWDPPKPCFKIPSNSILSGNGKIWEYYHFLIDFAAPMVSLLQNESREEQKTVVLPGWRNDDIFRLQRRSDPNRNMQPLADFLFRPLKVDLVTWGYQPQYNALQCSVLRFQSGSWSHAPASTYSNFRDYAQRLLPEKPSKGHRCTSDCRFGAEIVMIHRARVSMATCTGSCRRHLDGSFIPAITTFMKTMNSSTIFRIVETDHMELKEQIEIFSTAKLIIGMHGAGLSNWIFARPSTIVVELGHINWPCFEPLARRLKLEYHHCADIKFTSCIKSVLSRYIRQKLLNTTAYITFPEIQR